MTRKERLMKKFGWDGKSYSDLTQLILTDNARRVGAIAERLNRKHYDDIFKKRKDGSRMKLPTMDGVLAKSNPLIIKTQERGKLITETLRKSLWADLKDTLVDPEMKVVVGRGGYAGRISPKAIKAFEKRITQTFEGYTKKDPKLGVPGNIHTIAVTEVRTVVNQMKYEYANGVAKENPMLQLKKRWIHNAHLSKSKDSIRTEHQRISGKTVPLHMPFVIRVKGEEHYLKHPHDPDADPSQTIGCHCDYDIIVAR